MLQHSPLDQLKIKYNKAWLNTNVAKTQAFLEELVFHPSPFVGKDERRTLPKTPVWEATKTPTEKHIASIHGNFTFTCIHTLRLQKRGFLYEIGYISPGVTPYMGSECSFVFFLNRLTANERASISRAVLEMEANAVLYIQKHISAPLLAAVREMSPRSFSSWGGPRKRRK